MFELQIKIPPCLEGLKLRCGKLTSVVGVCQGITLWWAALGKRSVSL